MYVLKLKRIKLGKSYYPHTTTNYENTHVELKVIDFGDKYSKPMNAMVNSSTGTNTTVQMGSYGIGVSRLVGAIIEANYNNNIMKASILSIAILALASAVELGSVPPPPHTVPSGQPAPAPPAPYQPW